MDKISESFLILSPFDLRDYETDYKAGNHSAMKLTRLCVGGDNWCRSSYESMPHLS